MKIIYGFEDFKHVIHNMKQKEEKDASWLEYYKNYKHVFDAIFENLYMTDAETIRKTIIPNVNFYGLANTAEESVKAHDEAKITKIVEACKRYFHFNTEFNVYALVGFGHIDGTAISSSNAPFMYLGLERLVNIDVEQLIQHEFNHLVRFSTLNELNDGRSMTVGQLVIAEGLATLTPLVMNQMDVSETALQKMLFLDPYQYSHLKDNFDLIEQEIKHDFYNVLTPERMAKYFMMNEDSKYGKAGYFFGMHIILTLLNRGWDLRDLTYLDSELICDEFNK
ncbi:hypothetical protein A8F94_22570 [Bacillus sp. FJAT-27225]|uniref:DUF2268 domain-containing putative Zn-dependent protease n=1 Tax=Bacillus sp. FJAT-27225 TaxID=1743144 RepID=UPI00080C33C5|nr:DUF2268 domain-containing putative Zn-dependent protease [Bacillus sp. FJAT-27225]OCA81650.1 hypothetical protein A8F94_22570 [Bacillus sp. FJAT-27225]